MKATMTVQTFAGKKPGCLCVVTKSGRVLALCPKCSGINSHITKGSRRMGGADGVKRGRKAGTKMGLVDGCRIMKQPAGGSPMA